MKTRYDLSRQHSMGRKTLGIQEPGQLCKKMQKSLKCEKTKITMDAKTVIIGTFLQCNVVSRIRVTKKYQKLK